MVAELERELARHRHVREPERAGGANQDLQHRVGAVGAG